MNAPQPLTYREWLKSIPKKERQICPQCVGDGEVKCGCCGTIHTCSDCGGEGFFIDGNAPRDQYIAQVERERALYTEWMKAIGQTEKAIESELK